MSTTHTFYVCKHNTLMTLKQNYMYQRCRIGALFENSPVVRDNTLPGQPRWRPETEKLVRLNLAKFKNVFLRNIRTSSGTWTSFMRSPTIIHFLLLLILKGNFFFWTLTETPAQSIHGWKTTTLHGIVILSLKEITYYSGCLKKRMQCKVYIIAKCLC